MTEFLIAMRPVPVTLLAVLTLLTWKHGRGPLRWLMTGVFVGSLAYYSARSIMAVQPSMAILLFALVVPMPNLIWLIWETLFNDEHRFSRRHAVGLICSSTALFLFGGRTYLHQHGRDVPFYYVTAALALGIVALFGILTLRSAFRNMRGDLIESRRQFRNAFLIISGCNLIGFVALQAVGLAQGKNYGEFFSMLITVTSTINMSIALWIYAGPSDSFADFADAGERLLASAEKKIPASITSPADEIATFDERKSMRKTIDAAMDGGLYRQEDLSIKALAQAAKIPEYKVRKVIREECGFRNFNQYLNGFRIAEAARRLRDGDDDKIMAIAFDVGFKSIAPFNRAFREVHGVTPSEYRRRYKLGEQAS